MRALFFTLGLFVAGGATQRCSSFKVYWGFTGPSTSDPSSPPLDNSTAGLPYMFEPPSQTLIKSNPGPWPSCVTASDGSISVTNGGIPQNASVAAYVTALAAEMATWGLPTGWGGNGIFNMSWRPEFSFVGNDPCLAALSIARVRGEHPDWTNATQISQAAAAEFESAGAAFFEAALQQGTQGAYPGARWGFLGLPLSLSTPCVSPGLVPQCGYHHPTFGPPQRALNNNTYVARVANASTGVFPTLTLTLGAGAGAGAAWASRNMDALYGAVEQARTLSPGSWVTPLVTAGYVDAPASELTAGDLAWLLRAVYQAGGNGVVLQGTPFADAPSKAGGFSAYLASTLGPAVLSAVTDTCACAVGSCSDGGNCVGLVAGPACTPPVACAVPAAGLGARAPACLCSPHKQGATCNETAAVAAVAAVAARQPATASSFGSLLGFARLPGPRPGAPLLDTARAGTAPDSASSSSAAAVASTLPPVAPGCPSVPQDAHFPQFWNIVDQATTNKSGPVLDNSTLADFFMFTAGNQTRTGAIGGDYMPSCRSFFNKTANETQIQSFNGGIPQLANLTLLLNAVRDQVAGNFTSPKCHPTPTAPCKQIGWGLQPDFEGNAAFDFETWRPVFVGQWNDACMTNLSIAKVVQENPTWTNASQIFLQAELEFETAAMDIFVGMLDTGKAIAPQAKWGFYGYPGTFFNYDCRSRGDDPQCNWHNAPPTTVIDNRPDGTSRYDFQVALHDTRYRRLWAATTGLYPSCYLIDWSNTEGYDTINRDITTGNVAESVRIRDLYAPSAAVLPFAWNYYMAPDGDAHGDLRADDLQMMTTWTKYAGADGVIWWGAPYYAGGYYNNSGAEGLADFYAFLNTTFGPGVKAAVQEDCACSIANCSSKGLCIGPSACRCSAGWGGASCGEKL